MGKQNVYDLCGDLLGIASEKSTFYVLFNKTNRYKSAYICS